MTAEIFEALAAPFPPDRVSWRVGSTNVKSRKPDDALKGMALAFIDARDVMDRLDDVVGPGNWQDRYPHANGKTVCEIDIWIDDRGWVTKADGAGDTDYEASKGALSDAFKRAAVRWGIGRYLYNIPSPWVAIEQRGQSFIIVKDEYKKLESLLEKYSTEFEWGSPESRATLRVLTRTIQTCVQTADDVRRWREENAGTVAQMRVKAREHVNEMLDRIADASNARAA